jgi:hypothetical protein
VLASLALLPPAVVTIAGCASADGVEQEQVYKASNGFAVGDSVTVEYAESLVIATSNG